MPTYLYCLLGAGNDPPAGLAGVGAAPVRALATGAFSAWVATLAEPPRPSIDALQAHDAVTRAALETGETPVPVRFGQCFADDASCVAAIGDRATALGRSRDAVAGCVEMTALVRLPAAAGGEPDRAARADASQELAPATGRAYLERLGERVRLERFVRDEARRAREPISRAMRPLVRDERVAISTSPPLLTLSHLVPREALAEYRQALSSLGTGDISSTLVIRGPSAPYSFVTDDER